MKRVQSVGPVPGKVAEFSVLCNADTGNPTDFEALLKWVDLQNRPIADLQTTSYSCSSYNLGSSATLNIPANANRRSLRILNASGNAFGNSQCDILIGTKYIPTFSKFNKAIGWGADPLIDAPTLQHYVGCVAIGNQAIDGYFMVIEGF